VNSKTNTDSAPRAPLSRRDFITRLAGAGAVAALGSMASEEL